MTQRHFKKTSNCSINFLRRWEWVFFLWNKCQFKIPVKSTRSKWSPSIKTVGDFYSDDDWLTILLGTRNQPFCLSVFLSICVSVYLSLGLQVCLSVSLSSYNSVSLFTNVSLCLCVFLYLFLWGLSASLSPCLSIMTINLYWSYPFS